MPERTRATFRFYEELNDFLPEPRRKRDFDIGIDRARSVKDAIESAGVPHTEVDLILVDGVSVDFTHVLRGGERVAVYPMFERLDIAPLLRLRPSPLRDPRFVADVHLGKLARHLRMAGFDTTFEPAWDDDRIVACSIGERRTILTRDKRMLHRSEVERAYFVRSIHADRQLAEVVGALQLEARLAPFSRCRECNSLLEDARLEDVGDQVPERIRALYRQYRRCPGCARVYWEGSHFLRMKSLLDRMAPDPPL